MSQKITMEHQIVKAECEGMVYVVEKGIGGNKTYGPLPYDMAENLISMRHWQLQKAMEELERKQGYKPQFGWIPLDWGTQ